MKMKVVSNAWRWIPVVSLLFSASMSFGESTEATHSEDTLTESQAKDTGIEKVRRTRTGGYYGNTLLDPTPDKSPSPSESSAESFSAPSSSPSQRPTAVGSTNMKPRRQTRDGSFNLDVLNQTANPTTTTSTATNPTVESTFLPNFKFYFDLWLAVQPGVSPLSFEKQHSLVLVEYIPSPNIEFGFEVREDPRYYELDYHMTKNLTIRAGRIWIPFDDMNPHSRFGGRFNVSRFLISGESAFLPTLWTDLGVGLQYKWINTSRLFVESHLYVTNGFGDGGSDPTGENAPYPDFSTSVSQDNNTDKAIGARLHAKFFNKWGVGGSVYTSRFTDNEVEAGRILAFGADSQIHFGNFSVAVGYVAMNVTLPNPSTTHEFIRGGAYGEIHIPYHRQWKMILRAGMSQNDNRRVDVSDKTILGAALVHRMSSMFELSFQHYQDLNNEAPGKIGRSFSAARLAMVF